MSRIVERRGDRIELSLGRTSRAGANKGGKAGGILGLLLGTVFVVVTEVNETVSDNPSSSPGSQIDLPRLVSVTVGSGVVGYVGGRIFGAARKAEEWRLVYPTPPK